MDESQSESTTSTPSEQGSSKNIVMIVGIVVIIAIASYAAWQFVLSPKFSNETVAEISPTTGVENQPTVAAMTAGYKDGTYAATGKYTNPASAEDVDITITLANGVVTAATFAGTPDNPTTTTMQNKFKAGFTNEVVGKPIDEIALTVVNGSSLTPKGFMDALEKVKTEAKG